MKSYDVLVLGGGTAGSAAAKAAHEAGARTAMFNDGEIGGLCILRGCMPTKTMLHAAHLLHHALHHATPGVGRADLGHDFAAVMANKDAKVARFQRAKIASIESGGYEVIDARARFAGPDEVEAGGERYRFDRGAVIATGSVQGVPHIPGLDAVQYMTSDSAMLLEALPRSIVVLGTGAIGLEFAQFFARMGCEVELVSRRRVFQDVDPLISEEITAALRDEPRLTLHDRASAVSVRPLDGGVEMTCERDDRQFQITGEALFLATGRRPALAHVGVREAGIQLEHGRPVRDACLRTSNPKVFVAGDSTGDEMLLHIANWEGRAAGLGAAGHPVATAVDERLRMEVVFYDPPMATVGFNEARAVAMGHEVVCASVRFPETGRAITMDVEHGAWKLVADRSDGRILGAQILGPRADDLIHVVGSILAMRGTAAAMLEMPWYHPTLSEVLLQLARDIERQRAPS